MCDYENKANCIEVFEKMTLLLTLSLTSGNSFLIISWCWAQVLFLIVYNI